MRVGVAGAVLALLAVGCGDDEWGYPDTVLAATPLPFTATPPSASRTGPPPRGIVLIVIDTLRADHLGAYGSSRGLTPELDALAERSWVFENAIATSSWTRSSVASILTGCYPTSIDVLGREDAIADEVQTLAELLGAAGYRSWGITTNGNAGERHGFQQGFDEFLVPEPRVSYPDDFPMIPAEAVTELALEKLAARDPDAPFFLFLHYTDPHDPYLPHPELIEGPEPPGRFDGSRRDLKELDRLPSDQRTEDDMARIRHLYAGEVRYCDLWLGRLFDGIEELGLDDGLLTIVTADHGEGLWDHGRRDHGRDLYQETVRVPLIVHLPGKSSASAGRVEETVSLADIVPTVLASCGVASGAGVQGRDLYPLLEARDRGPAFASVYSEMTVNNVDAHAVWMGPFKAIRDRTPDEPEEETERWQLFDLSRDGAEHEPAASLGDAEPDLRRMLWVWDRELQRARIEGETVPLEELDADTLQQLHGLGYVGDDEVEEIEERRTE